jgi:hypothetical protein
MSVARVSQPPEDHLAPLSAAVQPRASARAIADLLVGDPPGWLPVGRDTTGRRRYAVDLRLRLGSGTAGMTTFRKAAIVDLGEVRWQHGGVEASIGWRASTAAPLFPVFAGTVRADSRTLAIDGIYAPPGGALGRLADRALLHVAATATARWLLLELDRMALGSDDPRAPH